MIRRSCQCSYPIWVGARCTGGEVLLVLHDGQRRPNRGHPPLPTCPGCHCSLVPADLVWRPISPHYCPPD